MSFDLNSILDDQDMDIINTALLALLNSYDKAEQLVYDNDSIVVMENMKDRVRAVLRKVTATQAI